MKVIAVISGFTEADFDITGSRKLYNELRVRFPEHVVEFAQWQEGEDLAKYFNSIGATDALVCAYSWGAGHGLVELSKGFYGNVRANNNYSICQFTISFYYSIDRFFPCFKRVLLIFF